MSWRKKFKNRLFIQKAEFLSHPKRYIDYQVPPKAAKRRASAYKTTEYNKFANFAFVGYHYITYYL